MNTNIIEIIGLVASFLLVISLCFKTETLKGSIWMRSLNIIGSIIFAIYGFLLPAYSTGIVNTLLVAINSYRLCVLIKENKQIS